MNNGSLETLARYQLCRMLTQVCRDPNSPFFGCWDRNWWHYKIRDFPSVILQQGGYALHLASGLKFVSSYDREAFKKLAKASAIFWQERAIGYGAFEEYYPFEEGYPPLAFSTLAVAKLGLAGLVPVDSLRPGLQVAARQLLSRFEAEASNQQVAGTASVAAIRKLAPDLIPDEVFSALIDRTLALQNEEGWFPEYGGPDLGYLTVTMDCLWDIYDLTGDVRCRESLSHALKFIAWFVLQPPFQAGMLNSRNTDYLVPYALARLAIEPSPDRASASLVFNKLFAHADAEDHFFASVDDRYWCHYIGHSLFRALEAFELKNSAADYSYDNISNVALNRIEHAPSFLPNCGHARLSSLNKEATVLVATKKGGIAQLWWDEHAFASDFGWIVKRTNLEYVSHWWSSAWNVSVDSLSASCHGALVSHKEHVSAPWKHILLRLASFVFGRRIISFLKKLLIFKKNDNNLQFKRTIIIEHEYVVIRDRIEPLEPNDEIVRAPRSSKRHVASADSFHPEDVSLIKGVKRNESIERLGSAWECVTHYERINESSKSTNE